MVEHAALEGQGGFRMQLWDKGTGGCYKGHQREGVGGVSRWPRFSWESGCEIDAQGEQKWR